MPRLNADSNKYKSDMLRYGPKRNPTNEEVLSYMEEDSIKAPWSNDGDVKYRKWLRMQWMSILIMFKPAEAKALTDKFLFLLEYAYMWDKKSVVEFTDYVDANLKIPASSPIFPLSTDHTNSPKFVERTLKQFFASDSMAECILGEWHGKACLTSDFTPSVLRFIMFRGVDAMYPKPTTIVTSELKLARFMHKNDINIDMNEKELREFCKTPQARKLFWLVVCMYVCFDRNFDREDPAEWAEWFDEAIKYCRTDTSAEFVRKHVIACVKEVGAYHQMHFNEGMGVRLKRLNVELNILSRKGELAQIDVRDQMQAARRLGNSGEVTRLGGVYESNQSMSTIAMETKASEIVAKSLIGVYVPEQLVSGSKGAVPIPNCIAHQDLLMSEIEKRERFLSVALLISGGGDPLLALLDEGESSASMESYYTEKASASAAYYKQQNEEEQVKRAIRLAENGVPSISRQEAMDYIDSRLPAPAPSDNFMFSSSNVVSQATRDFMDTAYGADSSSSDDDDVLHEGAIEAAVKGTIEKLISGTEINALEEAAADLATEFAVEIVMEELIFDLEQKDLINKAVNVAMDDAVNNTVHEIKETSILDRIEYRRSARNVLKTFNRVKESIAKESQSMQIEFSNYSAKVEQLRKKTEILGIMSEIRCISAEIHMMRTLEALNVRDEVLALLGELNDVRAEISSELMALVSCNKKVMFTLAAYHLLPKCILGVVPCGQCESPIDMSLDAAFNPRSGTFSCYGCILMNHCERLQLEYQITRLIKTTRKQLSIPDAGFDLQASGNQLSRFPLADVRRIFLATAPAFVPLSMHSDDVQCPLCLESLEWGIDGGGIGFSTCCLEFGFVCGGCVGKPHGKDHQSFTVDYEIARMMAQARANVGI